MHYPAFFKLTSSEARDYKRTKRGRVLRYSLTTLGYYAVPENSFHL